jgi:hypothetical protein
VTALRGARPIARAYAVAATVADQRKETFMSRFSQANQWGRQSGPTPQQAAAHARTTDRLQQEAAERQHAAADQNR